MKTVIMAGGKGTRISSVTNTIPKAMLKVADKPIMEHQIECLSRQGYKDFLIVTGHLGSAIQNYFGDGKRFGVHIEYYNEAEPLGTAGALASLRDILTEDFILINGDLIFDIDVERFVNFHRQKNALATIFTHPNSHPYDSEIIVTDSSSKVTGWLSRNDARTDFKNCVNAGIHIISPLLIPFTREKKDLDKDILIPLLGSGRLFAYHSPEYVKDMGTPERYQEVSRDFLSGKVGIKNLKNKQKAIFLDRDGTINEYKGLISNVEQIALIPGAAQAVKKINRSDYLAIIITNQPVIARGDCTIDELHEIHNRLESLLGAKGAYVDALYFCPHHPDKGFGDERPEYKMDCSCRKPKPGMIIQAANDYNIDLEQSFMVGDDIKDVLAGRAAGCKTAYFHSGKKGEEPADTPVFQDLLEFVDANIGV